MTVSHSSARSYAASCEQCLEAEVAGAADVGDHVHAEPVAAQVLQAGELPRGDVGRGRRPR